MHSRYDSLRARLATVLAVGTLYPLVTFAQDTGSRTEQRTLPRTDDTDADTDASCPTGADALAQFQAADTDAGCDVTEIVSEDGVIAGDCTYTVFVDCGDAPSSCGCYGRPYVEEGGAVRADAAARADWAELAAPDVADLSTAQRERLARAWIDAGRSEHSSIAGFARLVLELLAHGAPAELVLWAQRAGIEETGHTRACFALASAYAGAPVGPGALGIHAPAIAATLAELAAATVREGCIGETVAAALAGELHARATDPAVKAVLARIADEEAGHAELSWAILRWALEVGGDDVHRAVAEAFAATDADSPMPSACDDAVIGDHGVFDDATMLRLARDARERIVQPLATALG